MRWNCSPANPLDERLKAGPLPAAQVVEIGIGVARALEATHAIGVIHRDIKPANLFLTATGAVKVLDFGLAKVKLPAVQLGEDAPTVSMCITSRGIIIGSLPYMAPEQVRTEPIDGRADLYSLGVVLYECAAGDLPVHGAENFTALPAPLASIVAKLRAYDAAARYRTAAEAREALEHCGAK